MTYNVKVKKFAVSDQTLFEAGGANGCYVASGSAAGPTMINRMEVTPTGLIYDPDGPNETRQVPPVIRQELVFMANHPDGHTQYKNLVNLIGRRGTLTLETPGATVQTQRTAAARLLTLRGDWSAPFRVGGANELTIMAEWQLLELLS